MIHIPVNKNNPKDAKNTEISSKQCLHRSLKWVLFTAQCMGQIPVLGVTEPDHRSLRFTWLSWRCLYCLLNCLSITFLIFIYVWRCVKFGFDLFLATELAFHLSTLIMTLLFLKLAIEWPQLINKWSYVEFSMRNYGWPPNLQRRMTLTTTAVLVTAATEYGLGKLNFFYNVLACQHRLDDLFMFYITKKMYPQIFRTLSYSLWKGILIQIISVLTTFAWSFTDLFIMLMSTALALRFQQITTRLRLMKKVSKIQDVHIWQEIREDYNRLSQLTKSLDTALSYIILVSFANNLFFILAQLFNSLRSMRNTLDKVYFFFSFGFLILRTICVSLYGAWIYDESKEPLTELHSVPSEAYNNEEIFQIRRFIEQVNFDTVAISGKQFFYVTRGLILSMAGAIVSYELVLIQFNQNLLNESADQAASNTTSYCL